MKNECGFCVSQQSPDEIIKGIHFLISNEEYRKKIELLNTSAIGMRKVLKLADNTSPETKYSLNFTDNNYLPESVILEHALSAKNDEEKSNRDKKI